MSKYQQFVTLISAKIIAQKFLFSPKFTSNIEIEAFRALVVSQFFAFIAHLTLIVVIVVGFFLRFRPFQVCKVF